MRRGTTPTHTFKTDLDLTTAEVIYITYEQGDKVVFEKTKEDLTVTAEEITLDLTQADTLALSPIGKVYFQIRAKLPGGKAVASNIMECPAKKILKNGVI